MISRSKSKPISDDLAAIKVCVGSNDMSPLKKINYLLYIYRHVKKIESLRLIHKYYKGPYDSHPRPNESSQSHNLHLIVTMLCCV